MNLELAGKVAIVTGAAQGIGKAIAATLAAEGCRVIVADLQAEAGARVAADIERAGGQALALRVDVSRVDEVEALARQAVEAFGGIDILVADHAAPRQLGALWEVDPEVARRDIEINLLGTIYCARAVLPPMIKAGGGRIVAISSRAGRVGWPMFPWYSASKAGLIGFAKSLALDVGRYGITVNAVAPGRTLVERYQTLSTAERERLLQEVPLGKLGTPQDLADAVAFLCSARAGHITGQTLSVDGGSTRV